MRHNAGSTYTRPARAIYPHQWNWDSAICSLGLATLDAGRAWAELETLVASRHENGMIPHLIYHPKPGRSYLPRPEWWGPIHGFDRRCTSGITGPPVLGMCTKLLYERAPDRERARELLPHVVAWHRFLLTDRDPKGGGEPVLIHPWESGRDNAAEWDKPLERVRPTRTRFSRRDIRTVEGAERPTNYQYRRYLGLADEGRALGYDQAVLARHSTFRVHDPGFTAMLARSCADAAALAGEIGLNELASESAEHAELTGAALQRRVGEDGLCRAYDCLGETELDVLSCGSALALLSPSLPSEARKVATHVALEGALTSYCGVRSLAHDEPGFHPRRYWRGPVWANITFLVARAIGLAGDAKGETTLIDRLLATAKTAGMREYVEPDSGAGLGAHDFSWTAAIVLYVTSR